MSEKYIFCMKWGTLYGAEYVNKLFSKAERNLSYDFDPVRIGQRDAQKSYPAAINKKSILQYWPKEWRPSFKYDCHSEIPFNFWKVTQIQKILKSSSFTVKLIPIKPSKAVGVKFIVR
jgi:hypothetical protein